MNNKNKIIYGVLALVVLLGAFFFWQNQGERTSLEGQTIRLGMIFPLTSQFGTVAEGIRNASLMAVADYEAANPGVDVEVTIEDDGYDAAKGIAAYNKLKNIDKVEGIVSVSTPVIDALYKTYQKDGLPVINFGVQTEGVGDDNIFQILPDARGQVKPLADYLQNNTDYDQIVIVHSTNDVAPASFYEEFIKLYNKPYKEIAINTKDESRVVANRIIAESASAVVFILAPEIGASLTKEVKVLDKTGMDYYYDSFMTNGWDEYKKILGDTNVLNGATTIRVASSDISEFAKKYEAEYKIAPSIFAESGYDSTMIMLNTYNSKQSTWVSKIKEIAYDGIAGLTTFDEKGVRVSEYDIVKVVDGQIK